MKQASLSTINQSSHISNHSLSGNEVPRPGKIVKNITDLTLKEIEQWKH
jgi:hypothetical protein